MASNGSESTPHTGIQQSRNSSVLPIEIDPDTIDYAWTTTLHLADIHQITVYDASYLELALRRGLPLATRDEQLAAAAISAGATLLPTR